MKKTSKLFARSLRRNQTEAEKKLWKLLRSRQFQGFKFRRQQSLGPYVADFCSFNLKLIVEVDGGQHVETAEKDAERTLFLERQGYRVVRFWDHEVLTNVEGVLEQIRWFVIKSPPPRPVSRLPLTGPPCKPFDSKVIQGEAGTEK